MTDRPPIPAELRRRVLVESGHRCAIPTCRQTQIEVHHITPWEKCHSHEFANLIALCPNCHTRVHNGEIDRKALDLYKKQLVNLLDTEESHCDHGTVSSGIVKLNRADGKVHHLTVAGHVTIEIGDWPKEIDSIILKLTDAGMHATTWHGFSQLPFADGFCFKKNALAIVEIAHYSGEVVFNPISGGTTWKGKTEC